MLEAMAGGVRRGARYLGKLAAVSHAPSLELVRYSWFTEHEVARYDRAVSGNPAHRIDDQSWLDLELRRYLDSIASEVSIFGRQALYHRLRAGVSGDELEAAVAGLQASVSTDQVINASDPITRELRHVDHELAGLLFGDEIAVVPEWVNKLWWVPLFALAALVAMKLGAWVLGGVTLGAFLIVSGKVQISLYQRLQLWLRNRRALLVMLKVAVDWARLAGATSQPLLMPALQEQGRAEHLLRVFKPRFLERNPVLAEYANLTALYQYQRLGRELNLLRKELPQLRIMFELVSGIEADLALVRHLRQLDRFCWARPCGAHELELVDGVNPLLEQPSPLSLAMKDKGAFITGQNGVGKSTLLRAVGLNVVVARAFGFCYAKSAALPHVPVFTSIQIEDSLQSAQSLYMAELSRAQTLVRLARQPVAALFIVDEIFRGTNHLESVAAAAAVLHELAQHSLVLVSSHNLVLAPLLADDLQALCISRDTQDASRLRLEPGVLVETNGIAMMDEFQFPLGLTDQARKILQWLAGYLTHPTDLPRL